MRKLVLLGAAAVVFYAASGQHAAVSGASLSSAGDYSTAQLQALWVQAGGSQGAEVNAACHAMQESTGRPWVTSPNPDGGVNVGLWQLDTLGKGAGHSVAQLQDPLTNARVTVATTDDGANWTAWATPGC